MNKYILGIDLGTTNSFGCIYNDNKYNIIKNDNNEIFFPSIVEFNDNKGKVISSDYNLNCIKNIKRFIGNNKNQIEKIKLLLDLKFDYIIEDNIISVYNECENKYYTLEELNSLIIKKIVLNAEKQFNTSIKDVILTIPAYFDQIKRDSLLLSTKLAQVNCIKIINEPTAASIAYSLNYYNDIIILVFDFGGGTLDLSLVNIDENVIEVLNTQGDNYLGGEDFTKLIIDDVINEFENKNNIKFKNLIRIEKMKEIYKICDDFKCNLIDEININEFYGKINLRYSKKRNNISNLFLHLLEKVTNNLDIIFKSSEINKTDVDHIVLVGGSSKLIEINYLLKNYFNKELINNIDSNLVVVIGASIYGYQLKNPDNNISKDITLIDTLSISIGIESDNGLMNKIINKGTKLPTKSFKYFANEEDNQSELNINIYQGERELVKDNILVESFRLCNLKLKEKGKNIIKIEIKVDTNSMIDIIAYEKG